MSDNNGLDTLHDAFGELERRSDVYLPLAGTPRSGGRRRPRSTAVLVAASIVVVAALAVALATRAGFGPSHRHPAAGGAPGTTTGTGPGTTPGTARTTSSPAQRTPLRAHGPGPRHPHESVATGVLRKAPTGAATGSADITQQFAAVLQQVVGDPASFTAGPESGKAFLLGTLTVRGVTGGFDIQYFQAKPGDPAICDDTDRVQCHVSTPPGGGSLATGQESLQTDPGGITEQATYVRGDGMEFVMHVSNAADPKGAGAVGPKPPLTIAEMTAILTSDGWR